MADFLGTTGADTLNGTEDADLILGDAGNDILNGAGGNDVMDGEAGNDTVNGDAGDDQISITAGIDTVDGGEGTDTLAIDYTGIAMGALTIDLRNAFSGGVGKIVNNGVTGNITGFEEIGGLTGSNNADIVYLGNVATEFTVNLLAGDDKFFGGTLDDSADGGTGNDRLFGDDGSDTLMGNDGADYIDGGLGGDDMFGGKGNDTFAVDNALDLVFETDNAAGGGADTVNAKVSFQLGTYIERLVLKGAEAIDGTGNSLANRLTGNDAANILSGEGGNDILFGMGGADTLLGGAGNDVLNGGLGGDAMAGGSGNDIYYVNNLSDVVSESVLVNEVATDTGGTDEVFSKVSFQLGSFIEKLTLQGTTAIDGIGNAKSNVMVGNSGANVLMGEGGNDTILAGGGSDQIHGGAGANVLKGGAGADLFVFDVLEAGSLRDTVKDFVIGTDKIFFDMEAFTALSGTPEANIDPTLFGTGTAATTAEQRLVYNTTTGVLSYDADGSGSVSAQVAVAYFETKPALTADDIYVV